MKKIVPLLLLILLLNSCGEEELSSLAEILSFTIVDINTDNVNFNNVAIETENQKVYLLTSDPFNSESFPLQITPDIDISTGATITPGSGEKITFENDTINYLYVLTAEDGTEYEWYVSLLSNQLPNSDFEAWYDAKGLDGKYYKEPGMSEGTTLWATANKATSFYDVLGTIPLKEGDNTLAKITTGETDFVPVTAGTLFTGTFDVQKTLSNPTDPQQGTFFGVPFVNRPVAMKIKYKYEPGENYIKATLNDPDDIFGGFDVTSIDGIDQCKIFSYLETRDGENSTTIGEFEFKSGDLVTDLTELILPYTYTSSEMPTHITVVFTSSTDGDKFTGAVGSTLIIDDLELIYE